jgi:hypothetical protein
MRVVLSFVRARACQYFGKDAPELGGVSPRLHFTERDEQGNNITNQPKVYIFSFDSKYACLR